MELNLESNLMLWIGDEVERKQSEGRKAAVPIHLLLVHLAAYSRDDSELTESTELSLQTYDRANLYRTLRQMSTKGLIDFVNEKSEVLSGDEVQQGLGTKFMDQAGPAFVTLSEHGKQMYQNLQRS